MGKGQEQVQEFNRKQQKRAKKANAAWQQSIKSFWSPKKNKNKKKEETAEEETEIEPQVNEEGKEINMRETDTVVETNLQEDIEMIKRDAAKSNAEKEQKLKE